MSLPVFCFALAASAMLFGAAALLERLGVSSALLGQIIAIISLCASGAIVLARTTTNAAPYRSDRYDTGPAPAGARMALNGISGVALVWLAALAAGDAGTALALALAIPAGILLSGTLFVPAQRQADALTFPGFLTHRLGGRHARLAGIAAVLVVCIPLAAALMQAGAAGMSALLGLSETMAIMLGVGFVLLIALPGGARALGTFQPLHFFLVGIAFAALAAWILLFQGVPPRADSVEIGGHLLPEIAMAGDATGVVLFLCAAAGVAVLTGLLSSPFTIRHGQPSWRGGIWGALLALLAIALLMVLASALLPSGSAISWPDLSSLPLSGIPLVLTILAASAALVTALLAAAALILTAGNTLTQDLYFGTSEVNAPGGGRLFVARLSIILTTLGIALFLPEWPHGTVDTAAWALAAAASGLFPAWLLRTKWKGSKDIGAVAGIAAGIGVCIYYLIGTRYGAVGFHETWSWLSTTSPEQAMRYAELKAAWAGAPGDETWSALEQHARAIANWGAGGNLSAAVLGMPVGFVVMFVVSLLAARQRRQLAVSPNLPEQSP